MMVCVEAQSLATTSMAGKQTTDRPSHLNRAGPTTLTKLLCTYAQCRGGSDTVCARMHAGWWIVAHTMHINIQSMTLKHSLNPIIGKYVSVMINDVGRRCRSSERGGGVGLLMADQANQTTDHTL